MPGNNPEDLTGHVYPDKIYRECLRLLFFSKFPYFFINHILIGCDFRKPFHIFPRPGIIHFTIAAKYWRHQIVRRGNTLDMETMGSQIDEDLPGHMFLRIG